MNKAFTQLAQQLAAIWKQLGVNQRISMILTTIGVVAGLAAMTYYSSRQDYSLLYGKLDEAEAAKVVAALDEAKVPYKFSAGSGNILVPADKVYQLRMEMAGKGIPRGEGVGFEIFDKANFGLSDFVQRANYTRAVQGELARTISQLDQVESARVMIVMPENRLLADGQRKPTASVFVHVRGNGQLPTSAVNSIRFLVANSVEGLQANNVSVVDNGGNVLSQNDEPDSPSGLSNSQLTARRNLEQYLTKKAEGMLDKVLGPGQAVVRVTTEINWDTITRKEEKYDPDGQVARSSTINDDTTDSSTLTPTGGAPGTSANGSPNEGGTNSVIQVTPTNNSKTHKKVTTLSYEINKVSSDILQAAGGIKRISSAVFIAQRFEGKGAERKAVPRTPEELQKLKKIVATSLGIVENDPTRKDELALEEMAFNDQAEVEMTQKFEKQETKTFWIGLLEKMLYPGLAVGMIYLFWKTFKTAKFEEIPIGIRLGEGGMGGLTNGEGNGGGGNGGSYSKSKQNPGVVTVDVLNQLIRENPGNMSQAVRSWLVKNNKPNN